MDHAVYAHRLCADARSIFATLTVSAVIESLEMRQILAPTPAGIEWVLKLRAISTALVDHNEIGDKLIEKLSKRGHEPLWISTEWTV